MPCNCDERKDELREMGADPLLGDDYTAVDSAQWLIRKAFGKIAGK